MATRRATLHTLGGGVVAVAGCLGGSPGTRTKTRRTAERTPTTKATNMSSKATSEFAIEARAFSDGETIPARFTCDGADVSPELSIGGAPPEAETLALVVDDPDAPGGTFDHWLLWNVPADTISIPEDVPRGGTVASLDGARQGTNGFDAVGYRGPCPPKSHGAHSYRFTLYACDSELDVPGGASGSEVRSAIQNAEVAQTRLMGMYERT
ncbi:YbhB/YbcL family Raf kinase inhibitor-like protein [Haloarchaeobius sp. HME9146]|uniref:YbhB/YbcL family Raf kinase inhibitor-like protein n=1 Tax=Haloarchaeobius sp. HME9146 TaxID=2978732 RepID=UPI0021C23A7B|nr:YbhB/YbcL family Raf kinase inhibitor-like protein [Haloarchaeobius sp. HME9146]MCT9096717.1 YbhB/YbcL family Raf kinase inhibitor-like protein [Haloarchaeobius sp. HME9146]